MGTLELIGLFSRAEEDSDGLGCMFGRGAVGLFSQFLQESCHGLRWRASPLLGLGDDQGLDCWRITSWVESDLLLDVIFFHIRGRIYYLNG